MRLPPFLSGSLLSVFALCALSAQSVSQASSAQASGVQQVWLWPLEGERSIRLDYQAPLTEYGRGHRGIDLSADIGQDVRAPATGIVTYAGGVAGRRVLSLRVGDYLLSFEPLATQLSEGDVVVRGQTLGTVATGSHCDECLHVGVRHRGLYLSPMKFLVTLPRARLEAWDDEHWASIPEQ